jgi:hypothetical protein
MDNARWYQAALRQKAGRMTAAGLTKEKWLAWLCAGYLVFAFVQSAPWVAWHPPSLELFAMSPSDKTHLGIPRLLDMLALAYLVFSSARVRAFALSLAPTA